MERYNCTVRYSWLSQYQFESISKVQDYATRCPWFYNHERPNKANGSLPPKLVLAAACTQLLATAKKGKITLTDQNGHSYLCSRRNIASTAMCI